MKIWHPGTTIFHTIPYNPLGSFSLRKCNALREAWFLIFLLTIQLFLYKPVTILTIRRGFCCLPFFHIKISTWFSCTEIVREVTWANFLSRKPFSINIYVSIYKIDGRIRGRNLINICLYLTYGQTIYELII